MINKKENEINGGKYVDMPITEYLGHIASLSNINDFKIIETELTMCLADINNMRLMYSKNIKTELGKNLKGNDSDIDNAYFKFIITFVLEQKINDRLEILRGTQHMLHEK